MNRVHPLMLCLPLFVAACGVEASFSDADASAVRAQTERYVRAGLAGDADAWGDTLAEDVILIPPGQATPLHGREAAVKWLKSQPKLTAFTATPEEVSGSGDLAYMRGTYALSGALPDGTTIKDGGSFLQIHRRQANGTWPYVRLMWTSQSLMNAATQK